MKRSWELFCCFAFVSMFSLRPPMQKQAWA